MAIDTNAIRKALRAILVTAAGLPPATHRKWENRDMKVPDPPAPWMRETLIPIGESGAAIGTIQFDGMMSYDLFFPKGSGTEACDALAKEIKEKFKPYTGTLTAQPNAQISVMRCEPLPGRDDGAYWMVPIRVRFLALVPTT